MVKKIVIIGGGVIGLTCAVVLKESYPNVTLISEKLSPNTTGDGSAGLWSPYILGDTPEDVILKWSSTTFDYFHKLWLNGKAELTGISLIPAIKLTTETIRYNAYWKDVVFGYTELNEKQLKIYSKKCGKNYTGGCSFTTFTCEPTKLLPYLYNEFITAGGKFEQKKITSFDELSNDYDLIINCTGLGAQYLVNDKAIAPVRGQVIRIEASWLFHTLIDDDDDGNYIIPNMESVVLGGTYQENNYNQSVSTEDSSKIWQGCNQMEKSLINGKILREWVGLRPGRTSLRLDVEKFTDKKTGRTIDIIHNYGHGGSGVTLCWGCAIETLSLVKQKTNI